jgi:hypothetical protein
MLLKILGLIYKIPYIIRVYLYTKFVNLNDMIIMLQNKKDFDK